MRTADFVAWASRHVSNGTDVVIQAWPKMGWPNIEILAGGRRVGAGMDLIGAIESIPLEVELTKTP